MFVRVIFAVVVLTLVFSFAGCSATPALDSIQVTPPGGTLTAVGQTAQFTAIATRSTGGSHFSTLDVTNQAQWSSSSPSVATISSTGLATAVAVGTTNITASLNGTNGMVVSNVATLNVSVGLVSISIIPPASPEQILNNPGETSQFIATGLFSGTPTTLDMTNQLPGGQAT